MLNKIDFLKKYNISNEEFVSTNLDWNDLEKIATNHVKSEKKFVQAGRSILEYLQDFPKVHSMKMRVKDPEHLVEKIIRKTIKNPELGINSENYEAHITDLVGVRALHLFKDDWIEIDKAIRDTWELLEKPVANIRAGDDQSIFNNNECDIKERDAGYRSVHYLTKCGTDKKPAIAEIQVRTIFEEGWSEIDHIIRYPYEQDNPFLLGYLSFFNRLAGTADEMGSYIRSLQNHLREKDENYQKILQQLEESKKSLPDTGSAKASLQNAIDVLSQPDKSAPKIFDSYFLNEDLMKAFKKITDSHRQQNEQLLAKLQSRRCESCSAPLNILISAIGDKLCPKCKNKSHTEK